MDRLRKVTTAAHQMDPKKQKNLQARRRKRKKKKKILLVLNVVIHQKIKKIKVEKDQEQKI
jgi:hypothetical protein